MNGLSIKLTAISEIKNISNGNYGIKIGEIIKGKVIDLIEDGIILDIRGQKLSAKCMEHLLKGQILNLKFEGLGPGGSYIFKIVNSRTEIQNHEVQNFANTVREMGLLPTPLKEIIVEKYAQYNLPLNGKTLLSVKSLVENVIRQDGQIPNCYENSWEKSSKEGNYIDRLLNKVIFLDKLGLPLTMKNYNYIHSLLAERESNLFNETSKTFDLLNKLDGFSKSSSEFLKTISKLDSSNTEFKNNIKGTVNKRNFIALVEVIKELKNESNIKRFDGDNNFKWLINTTLKLLKGIALESALNHCLENTFNNNDLNKTIVFEIPIFHLDQIFPCSVRITKEKKGEKKEINKLDYSKIYLTAITKNFGMVGVYMVLNGSQINCTFETTSNDFSLLINKEKEGLKVLLNQEGYIVNLETRLVESVTNVFEDALNEMKTKRKHMGINIRI